MARESRREGRGRWLVVTAGVLILVLGWGSLTRPWAEACPLVYAILPAGAGLSSSASTTCAAGAPTAPPSCRRMGVGQGSASG